MGSCYASTVIKTAQGEIGYKESGNNWTKYARDLDSVHYFNGNKQNIAWCATFVCWCVWKSCTSDSASGRKWDALYFTYEPSKDNCACGAKYCAGYFRSHGAYHSSPKKGDFAFFGPKGAETHVGLVEKIDGNYVYTIEGNHGDKVARVKRSKSEISGYGRPRYDSEPTPTPPTPTPDKKPYPGEWPVRPSRGYFQRYDKGPEVVKLQKLLLWTKPGCLPKYGADGDIGSETLQAVYDCQGIWGTKQDKFYGANSEKAAKAYKK